MKTRIEGSIFVGQGWNLNWPILDSALGQNMLHLYKILPALRIGMNGMGNRVSRVSPGL